LLSWGPSLTSGIQDDIYSLLALLPFSLRIESSLLA